MLPDAKPLGTTLLINVGEVVCALEIFKVTGFPLPLPTIHKVPPPATFGSTLKALAGCIKSGKLTV